MAIITLAVFASPNNFDPRVGTDEVSQKVYQLVYDTLLNLDDELKVGPGLAMRWEQPDDRTVVVHLRRGVRFHDGHELTSADVAHTFNSLIDPAFISARRGAYAALDRVEIVDRYWDRRSAVHRIPPSSMTRTDPAKARTLLDEAGYPDPDAAGPQPAAPDAQGVDERVLSPAGCCHSAGLEERGHRSRCAQPRVRNAGPGCRPRQFPAGDLAMGSAFRILTC